MAASHLNFVQLKYKNALSTVDTKLRVSCETHRVLGWMESVCRVPLNVPVSRSCFFLLMALRFVRESGQLCRWWVRIEFRVGWRVYDKLN